MINRKSVKYRLARKYRFRRLMIGLIFIALFAVVSGIFLKKNEPKEKEVKQETEFIYVDVISEESQALELENKRLNEVINSMADLKGFPSFEAEVTWYTAGYESTGKTPDHPAYGITSSGKIVQPSHTIAASKSYPFGTKILIDNIVYVVEDRGGLIKDNKIDIYVENLSDIPTEGRVTKVAYILEWGPSK